MSKEEYVKYLKDKLEFSIKLKKMIYEKCTGFEIAYEIENSGGGISPNIFQKAKMFRNEPVEIDYSDPFSIINSVNDNIHSTVTELDYLAYIPPKIYCPSCSAEYLKREGVKFCEKCGVKLIDKNKKE